nr:beta-propeller fold lactonase family protein [Mycobacterium tuberculosis]
MLVELSGAVSSYKYEDGKLKLVQNVSAHPFDYKGNKGSADIHVSKDGKFLELSGAVSSYKYEDGKLKLVQNVSAHPFDYKGNKRPCTRWGAGDGRATPGTRTPVTVGLFWGDGRHPRSAVHRCRFPIGTPDLARGGARAMAAQRLGRGLP